jgi:hypothetical protein
MCYRYVETKRSLIDVDGDDVGVVVKFDKALDKRLNLYNYIKVPDGVITKFFVRKILRKFFEINQFGDRNYFVLIFAQYFGIHLDFFQ